MELNIYKDIIFLFVFKKKGRIFFEKWFRYCMSEIKDGEELCGNYRVRK